MTIARQPLSTLRRLPIVTSALRTKPTYGPYTSMRMESGKVKAPVTERPKDADNNPDHTDGAMASLKGTPGKGDATSFENQNLTEKEKKTNSQNAQANDSREGIKGEAGEFKKSGRKPKP
ncbi:hypothetical protein NW752_012133 [Fusarium irregulare]|uniref:Uncharacterized protein n=1 Tax=Fusarium irregulare TaxID=2494466 RepID=A0A9W8U6J2_9HYPO|nr:hypothetical protein NW752_012133 [Fusarium irregulare]KAJ4006527.1 hypothetical protein NW766_010621 [Fusarium irregulare]